MNATRIGWERNTPQGNVSTGMLPLGTSDCCRSGEQRTTKPGVSIDVDMDFKGSIKRYWGSKSTHRFELLFIASGYIWRIINTTQKHCVFWSFRFSLLAFSSSYMVAAASSPLVMGSTSYIDGLEHLTWVSGPSKLNWVLGMGWKIKAVIDTDPSRTQWLLVNEHHETGSMYPVHQEA